MQNKFDLILVGGGASGLSLLHYLQELRYDASILLVEPDPQQLRKKTWCFWHEGTPPLPSIVDYTWNQFQVGLPGENITFDLAPFRYSCVRGTRFFEYLWPKVTEHPQVTVLREPASKLYSDSDIAYVQVGSQVYQSPYIFQSAFLPPHTLEPRYPVWQHFLGWELSTQNPQFDPDTPTFMDFDTDMHEEVAFTYILPWSNHKALVEYTVFSDRLWEQEEYELHLKKYIREQLRLDPSEYSIDRVERGKIPMMDRNFPTWYDQNKRIYNLGGMAGLTKASTGYTFLNIQRHTQQLAKSLYKGSPLPHQTGSSSRFRIYDLLLLHVIQEYPERALEVFSRLFTQHPIQRVLRFLDEQTNLGEELTIMAKMPYPPFFSGIGQNLLRFLTGRY
jgi:lycopene beta-cyclase